MRLTLLLLLSSLCFSAFGQVKPIYFIGDKVVSDSTYATSFAIYGKLANEDLWVFKRYDLQNELLSTGSFKDSLLTVQHGEFIFYKAVAEFSEAGFNIKGKTRYISAKGTYRDGQMEGRWFAFYPDGNVLEYLDYKGGKANGAYKLFNKFGVVQESGQYTDSQKDGEWLVSAGKRRNVYQMGKLVSTAKNKKI